MNNVVVSISRSHAPSVLFDSARVHLPSREILTLGLLLATLQILDGILTVIGVGHFGLGAEANLLIRFFMESFGPASALIILKSIALVIIALLCSMAKNVHWIPLALKAMIVLYMVAAIIPWSAILIHKLV